MQGLLCHSEDSNGRLRLAQLVVDADESLHSSPRGGRVLVLLVVQRLGKGVALLSESAQRPEGSSIDLSGV